jgi:hypothetical protein
MTLNIGCGFDNRKYGGFALPVCIQANTGIYIDVGTNTTVYVDYVK